MYAQIHRGSTETIGHMEPADKAEDRDFELLTKQHKDAVYRQMIRACGNREDAEDVLVEALLKAERMFK